MRKDTYLTTHGAAKILGVTDARVRQICISHDAIGLKHGTCWLLTQADIRRIRKLPEFGKRKRTSA